ncbi:MAG: hypothetical protein M3Q95_07825 [Bacteroidota bacterium]|nr:hypothetical protein [Bacteroidota bacterium]
MIRYNLRSSVPSKFRSNYENDFEIELIPFSTPVLKFSNTIRDKQSSIVTSPFCSNNRNDSSVEVDYLLHSCFEIQQHDSK